MTLSALFRRPGVLAFVVSAIANAVLWYITIFIFPKQETTVLHYSVDLGIDFIGTGQQIYLLPIIGLAALVGNGLIGLAIRRADSVSALLAWWTAPFIQIILIGALILIYQANV